MGFFQLPNATKVNKSIPKNSFDQYTNTRQKRQFIDFIDKIVWTNKISSETVNLIHKEIKEIQLFKIELKVKDDVKQVIDIIDKSIPYAIIFWIEHDSEAFISTSSKHTHPTNEDNAIIDWTFKSDWFKKESCPYNINLKKSIDESFKDFCVQLTGKDLINKSPLESIVAQEQLLSTIGKEIERLQGKIRSSKQFNEKVKLNLELKRLEFELKGLKNN